MHYMRDRAGLRAHPQSLVPGVMRSISVRMDYLPQPSGDANLSVHQVIAHEKNKLDKPAEAVISVYARGRDYHKVMRSRLQRLSDVIAKRLGDYGYRVFTDSAPVMEVELARKSGLGWRGKHSLLLNREAGSLFFLGEILVDIPLPIDEIVSSNCGNCTECMDICPTKAIVAPYVVDARRCISYLTIEHPGAIPEELRPLMGNRIYGCDDCQLYCPWNKYAQFAKADDFAPRHGLEASSLLRLWEWTSEEFEQRLQGSPIRRIGYQRWLRNLAVALGNALATTHDPHIATALRKRLNDEDELVKEHVSWALRQG
jgi:epoxyqueuosine reductase